jgi:hypothetical protein
MSVPRLVAVAFILAVAAVAWAVLGASVDYRTTSADTQLRERVGGLWGRPQEQRAPTFDVAARQGGGRMALASSDVHADLKLDQRRKGLLWYATYGVAFRGAYRVQNSGAAGQATMTWPLPVPGSDYNGFVVKANGREVPATFGGNTATAHFPIAAGSTATVEVAYRTQGLDRWSYAPSTDGANAIRDFTLVMTTDFPGVDFPEGAVSPTAKKPAGNGWELTWRYDSLVSGRAIALDMPKPLNPGPVASRISLFAPVSLLFFFASLVLLTSTRQVNLHPMNYAFLAAGFFAFHLLFAYLVDRVDINLAFALSALTSLALCIGYLWLAIGRGPALAEAAVGQFVFLVLFSYSFFFEGTTGLTITIGAILTLGYFMLRTARTDWGDVFRRDPKVTGVPIDYRMPPAPAPQG